MFLRKYLLNKLFLRNYLLGGEIPLPPAHTFISGTPVARLAVLPDTVREMLLGSAAMESNLSEMGREPTIGSVAVESTLPDTVSL